MSGPVFLGFAPDGGFAVGIVRGGNLPPRVRLGSTGPRNYGEAEIDATIALLKAAKVKAWPKPLKPLCPASAQLLVYLKAHGDITPIKAREELGIEHLPRRIKDLKEHGHDIRTDFKRGFAGKRYGRYVYTPLAVAKIADFAASRAEGMEPALTGYAPDDVAV